MLFYSYILSHYLYPLCGKSCSILMLEYLNVLVSHVHPGWCTWAFLAGEWQVVVAGHVVPLAALVPDHHHTVLSRVEIIIWLVRPPVHELLRKRRKHQTVPQVKPQHKEELNASFTTIYTTLLPHSSMPHYTTLHNITLNSSQLNHSLISI